VRAPGAGAGCADKITGSEFLEDQVLLGSVVHEGVPLALASIHAGDWLTKLILVTAIVGIWR
jgi:hypothetical protein